MIRSLINFSVFNTFVLLLPLFGTIAWFAGSSDEKFLMKAATCALGPFCAGIWLIILRKGKWSSLLVIPLGYGLIIPLLRMRVIVF